MRPGQIRAILEEYLSPLPRDMEGGVIKYMELLELWGRRMPLTSVRDREEVLRFHFGESIFALSLIDIDKTRSSNGRLADVGSGAGFPGLALKLAKPELSVTLIESNRKKSAFLHEAIRSLSIMNVEVISKTFESTTESASIEPRSLAFVACRALGRHSDLLDWAKHKLRPGGSVLLWLGDRDSAEISRTEGWIWDERVLLPCTKGRFILRGTPLDMA